jgi:diguanylate cyclase (GGDEF)-like protein
MDEKNQTILIIEDPLIDDEALRSILGSDYRLLFAGGGKQALEIDGQKDIDLVLWDVDTPGIAADDVFSLLSANPANHNAQILLMVRPGQEGIWEGRPAEVADWIGKPLQPSILKARVQSHLELKGYRDFWESISTNSSRMRVGNQWRFDFLMAREWQRALRNQTPISMILIDIDFFKEFEALKGRSAGDQVLWLVGEVLHDCVKRGLDFIARHETHAFVCLLPDTDTDGAHKVCQLIQEKMVQLNIPHPGSPVAQRVTVSIGVATVRPSFKMEQDELLRQAEELLEEARIKNHNQVRGRQS